MDTEYLDIQDVAFLLNTSSRNVRRLLDNGEIPFTRYHRRVIIKTDDLLFYLARMFAKAMLITRPDAFFGAFQDRSPPDEYSEHPVQLKRHPSSRPTLY